MNPEVQDQVLYEKSYISAQIRRFSHYKDTEKINSWIDENYHHDEPSHILKQPDYVIEIISEVVRHFSRKIKVRINCSYIFWEKQTSFIFFDKKLRRKILKMVKI